jgi:hypothetical protein
MRTATTDERARRWFRRYWTFGVGSGAHVLVNGVIELTRDLPNDQVSAFAIDSTAALMRVHVSLVEMALHTSP